jgi:hypothetical protein
MKATSPPFCSSSVIATGQRLQALILDLREVAGAIVR